MTGFAQVRGRANDQLGFTLSLKSVNHRFLDLHFRLPPESEALEIKLRRLLKERLARGHVDVSLSLEGTGAAGFAVNRAVMRSYVEAFRTIASETGVAGEPDLNLAFRIPGALEGNPGLGENIDVEDAVVTQLEEAIQRLNAMRGEEGASIVRELRERLDRLEETTTKIETLREPVLRAHVEKLRSRMEDLIGGGDSQRILQEAALLAERSDIQEELVRMQTHIRQVRAMLEQGGEVGKKLDFLAQEMNREANTLLSKTSGLAGEALRITEFGLAMKSEVEKIREQVQNLE